MGRNPRGVLIITLESGKQLETIKKRIARIKGVTDSDYSYLTHKLQVRYEGDQARLQEIDSEIRKVLQQPLNSD